MEKDKEGSIIFKRDGIEITAKQLQKIICSSSTCARRRCYKWQSGLISYERMIEPVDYRYEQVDIKGLGDRIDINELKVGTWEKNNIPDEAVFFSNRGQDYFIIVE